MYDATDFVIPATLLASLSRYGRQGIRCGGFLTAALENNFTNAVCYADPQSFAALKDIAQYIHNEMPSQCHGSREKVEAWLAGGWRTHPDRIEEAT